MTKPTERDHGLFGLVERIMRKPEDLAPVTAEAEAAAQERLDPVVQADAAPALLEPQFSVEGPRTRSPSEMADIILRALKAIEGCPKQGFEVIVYGARPWNAMLRITPAVGQLSDAQAWRARVRDMVPLLREQYDVVD
jgi:hypothetical protein